MVELGVPVFFVVVGKSWGVQNVMEWLGKFKWTF
jgi:homoserine acetyltransferase